MVALYRSTQLEDVNVSSVTLYIVDVLKCLVAFGFSFYTYITRVLGDSDSGSDNIKFILLMGVFVGTYVSEAAVLNAFSKFQPGAWSSTSSVGYLKVALTCNVLLALLLATAAYLDIFDVVGISDTVVVVAGLGFIAVSGILFLYATTYLSILINGGWAFNPNTPNAQEKAGKRLFVGGLCMAVLQVLAHSLYLVCVAFYDFDILDGSLLVCVLTLEFGLTCMCIGIFFHGDGVVAHKRDDELVYADIGNANYNVSRSNLAA